MMTEKCDCNDFFFFNDTATTEIYTLSLHDALPISLKSTQKIQEYFVDMCNADATDYSCPILSRRRSGEDWRSEEHTSELQSQSNLVCRLLLEKKNCYFKNAIYLK